MPSTMAWMRWRSPRAIEARTLAGTAAAAALVSSSSSSSSLPPSAARARRLPRPPPCRPLPSLPSRGRPSPLRFPAACRLSGRRGPKGSELLYRLLLSPFWRDRPARAARRWATSRRRTVEVEAWLAEIERAWVARTAFSSMPRPAATTRRTGLEGVDLGLELLAHRFGQRREGLPSALWAPA